MKHNIHNTALIKALTDNFQKQLDEFILAIRILNQKLDKVD